MSILGSRFLPALGLLLWVPAVAAPGLKAQEETPISFESPRPRLLVLMEEEGGMGHAAGTLASLCLQAGFPLVEPDLLPLSDPGDAIRRAMEGDVAAALSLGRDLGAQVLIVGQAEGSTRPDPIDGTLVTSNGHVSVKALRLDSGEEVDSARGEARGIGASEADALAGVLGTAVEEIWREGSFPDRILGNWREVPWSDEAYWSPDPGAVAVSLGSRPATAPGIAVLEVEVKPSSQTGARGVGVVFGGDRSAAVFNPVRIGGVVVGDTRAVSVAGQVAALEELDPGTAQELGLEGENARRFRADLNLPLNTDTVRLVAQGVSGAVSESVVIPRISRRWALVVGISEYQSETLPSVASARSGAEAFHEFLLSPSAGPFQADRVLLLTDAEATGAALREAMFRFLAQAGKDDLVLIYYAGHGVPDPARPANLYLLPYDSSPEALRRTGIPLWDLKTALRRHIAAERVVVISDASHPGGTGGDESVANPIARGFLSLFTPSQRLSMTAAGPGEVSMPDDRLGEGGVFNGLLLEGLRGSGDGNGDGIVTFKEVFEFTRRGVARATEGRQSPVTAGLGDVPLSVVVRGSGPAG